MNCCNCHDTRVRRQPSSSRMQQQCVDADMSRPRVTAALRKEGVRTDSAPDRVTAPLAYHDTFDSHSTKARVRA